jgi:endonuclease VIII
MPEGDTLARTAAVLRAVLVGALVTRAAGRTGGAAVGRLEGSRVVAVQSRGKHLLIDVDTGLTLHSHLGMTGSWHRYAPGEPWRRAASRAVVVIETERAVAACFDAPLVEVLETRALRWHPVLAALGPDLLADPPDIATAVSRLREPGRAARPIAEVLLDQSAVAGIGNVYRSEVLFIEGIDPFAATGSLDPVVLERLLRTAAQLLRSNLGGGARRTRGQDARAGRALPGLATAGGRLWVYRRAGRPCLRCGTLIRSALLGTRPRRSWWCPACQAARPAGSGPA